VIRITNVQKGYIEDADPKFYPIDCIEELSKYSLKTGDLLMSLTGNVGRVAVLTENFLPAVLNQRVACLRMNTDKVLKKFIFHVLNSDYFEEKCILASNGIAQKNLSTEWLKKFEIPEFSISKQKKIADNLDKVSHTIDLCSAILEKLDLLVKSRFVEMFGSKDYPILKWNDVFNTTTGKLDSNAMAENGAYPFFTCSKEVLRINTYAFDEEALLLAGNNAAGKYDVKHYCGKFNAYQRTYVLTLKQNWSYVLFKCQLEEKLDYLQQQSLGGLTKYLTLKILGKLEFIVPPLNLQKQFATFVKQVDKAKQKVKETLEKAETLKKKLMQDYFG
jgi:restriction endonuclease S subunit